MDNKIVMIEKQLANIRALFLDKKYDAAFKIANELITDNLENNELNLEIAKIYFVKQNYKNSEKIFLYLQKNKDFFFLSTEMLQKIYKICGLYDKSIIQFYKLYKFNKTTEENILDALESALASKRYSTYLKLLMIIKKDNMFDIAFVNSKMSDVYEKIIKLISDLNSRFEYKNVKKMYRTIICLIPQKEKKVRNVLLNEYEIATGCYKLKSKPRVLTIELTNRCNLKCIMCEYKTTTKCWEISDNVYNELLSLIPYLENLILQGGEVFLYKNIKNILNTAITNKVSVEIVTNGLLLTEDILNVLIKGKNIITFSIDSIKKNVYETIRVNGKFDKLIENLNKLLIIKNSHKNNITLRLHMVVMKRNYMEIEDIINFAGKYCFSEVYLEPVANKYIESKESIFEFGYDKKIVSILENKKNAFDILAKKNNIKLINHLPSTKYCESISSNKSQSTGNIKNFLWLFKFRKENNKLNYNYSNKIYNDEIIYNKMDLRNNRLFCYAPWHKLCIFGKNIFLPTCFCPVQLDKIILNPFLEKLKNEILKFIYRKNFILSKWNGKLMMYYRKAIILKKEKQVCAKDCYDNRIELKERCIRY